MAERAKSGNGRLHLLRPAPLNSPAVQSARRQFSWLWSRESLLRLVLSLVLATALWLYVTGRENPSSVDFATPIPISPTGLNSTLIVTSPLGTVHISYHPSNPNIFPTASSFTASINLVNAHPGRQTVPVSVTSDPGFSVTQVTPSHVTVLIEPFRQKKVGVVVQYLRDHRTPADGYYALPAQATPNVVNVSGPQSLVDQVKDVVVVQSLTGAASTISTSAKPVPENSSGNPITGASGLTIDPSPVSVTIPIRAIGGVKTVPVLVSILGHPRVGVGVTGVSVDPPSITVSGSPLSLNRITTVTASVNVSGKRSGTVRRRVNLRVGRGITPSARTATVVIHLSAIGASTSTDVAVRPLGVGTGLVAHITPKAVLVTLFGPSTSLASATRGLDATVNLTNLGPGVYTLTPNMTIPPGFTLHGSNPQSVTVNVEVAPTR